MAPIEQRVRSITPPAGEESVTYLLLFPAEALTINGAFELGATFNTDLTRINGIDNTKVLIYVLQEPQGKSMRIACYLV